MKNYYEILEITQDASKVQIKEAYRKLVKKYHPDANNGDPSLIELIKDVNEANNVLSDHLRKLEYDREFTSYNLSRIFNPDNLSENTVEIIRRKERSEYIRRSVKTSATFLGLFGLLVFFMVFVFPIHDNEWELAHRRDVVSNSGDNVNDLFGKEEIIAKNVVANTEKEDKPFAAEESKVIDVTGPEVITAPVVVKQSFGGAETKPLEPLVIKAEVKPIERKVVAIQPAEVVTKDAAIESVEKKVEPAVSKPTERAIRIAAVKRVKIINKFAIKVVEPNPSVPIRRPSLKQVTRNLSEADQEQILKKLEAAAEKYNNQIKCVQLAKTTGSNISNAFMITDFLNVHGYAIAGRKIVSANIKGVRVDAKSGCIILTIGSM